MKLFQRIRDLMEANISDMVGKAEDPEKMLNLYVDRASEELRNFQIQVNQAVADQIALERKIETSQKDAADWSDKARLAVQQGRDDLARTALERQKTAREALESYQSQLTEQKTVVEELKHNFQLLDGKLQQAKSERDQLVMRERRAKALKGAADAVQGLAQGRAYADIDRMKDKVDRMEASAGASRVMLESTVESQFDQLKRTSADSEIEDELAKLKEELGSRQ
ncbi:MAG: PspA/IM30 family protein [Peptococcaceae bacterium]|nr:PspA/IM30 family protein [Peptococcaceae bacterium]